MNADISHSAEEVLMADFNYIFLSKTYEDLEGKQIEISGSALNDLKAKAERLRTDAMNSEDFFKFAKDHSEASTIEMTVGQNDLPASSSSIAFALSEGQISQVIEEMDGLYIFYRKNMKNELATVEAEEKKILELSKQYFDNLYKKWRANIDVQINTALWDAM